MKLTLTVLLCGVCSAADVVTEWNTVALDAIRASNTAPPAAARNLAILHTAIYDAVNGIRKTHKPYFVSTDGPDNASVEAAAAAAARSVLLALYPGLQNRIEAEYQSSLRRIPNNSRSAQGIQWGELVATAILGWRSGDGASNTVPYTPGSQPGQWRPTISFGGVVRPALLPGWGSVVPFALAAGSQFRPPAAPALSSPQYAAEVNFVRAIGGAVSSKRTVEQTEIALFWGYGPSTATPPGHWNEIAHAVADRNRGRGNDENDHGASAGRNTLRRMPACSRC